MTMGEIADGGDIKGSVQRQFSQVAANYSTSSVHARGPDLAMMVQAAALRGRERLLDAGAGTGHTALAFAPHVGEVIALDLTAAMLAQGRRLAVERGLHNIEFRLGDVERLPFADASFDIVTSRYSAHHWPHPERALHELARVLRPGGQLLLGDVVAPDEPTGDTFLNAIELLRDPSHVRDHSQAQWLTMLAAAGFSAEALFTWDLRLEFEKWVRRMATPAPAVAMIKTLLDGAPHEIRRAMRVERADYSFTIMGALFRGRPEG